MRAAENSIKALKPEKQISFLFLPDKEDPDSYVNKNGKDNFIDFAKQSKLLIHQFIFSHYKKQTENNPSSMAIFEKKLRNIANTINDDFIKKYVLEYFLEKIAELTPHSNQNKKKFETIIKKLKSDDQIRIEDLQLDKQWMEKINKFAPIKHILKNQSEDKYKIMELLDDISRDLLNYDLEFRIQELESKFSIDMSETTFNELKELKKKQNLN